MPNTIAPHEELYTGKEAENSVPASAEVQNHELSEADAGMKELVGTYVSDGTNKYEIAKVNHDEEGKPTDVILKQDIGKNHPRVIRMTMAEFDQKGFTEAKHPVMEAAEADAQAISELLAAASPELVAKITAAVQEVVERERAEQEAKQKAAEDLAKDLLDKTDKALEFGNLSAEDAAAVLDGQEAGNEPGKIKKALSPEKDEPKVVVEEPLRSDRYDDASDDKTDHIGRPEHEGSDERGNVYRSTANWTGEAAKYNFDKNEDKGNEDEDVSDLKPLEFDKKGDGAKAEKERKEGGPVQPGDVVWQYMPDGSLTRWRVDSYDPDKEPKVIEVEKTTWQKGEDPRKDPGEKVQTEITNEVRIEQFHEDFWNKSDGREKFDAETGKYHNREHSTEAWEAELASREGGGEKQEKMEKSRKRLAMKLGITVAALSGLVVLAGTAHYAWTNKDATPFGLALEQINRLFGSAGEWKAAGGDSSFMETLHDTVNEQVKAAKDAAEAAAKPEFAEAATQINEGEGWFNTMKEMGIANSVQQRELLTAVGPTLQEQGIAYKMGDSYGINMTEDGKMPEAALNAISQAAKARGWL